MTTDFLSSELIAHKERLQTLGLTSLFEADAERFSAYSARCGDLLLDFSKNFLDESSFSALLSLAHKADLKSKINAMFDGEPINNTEERQVLHTALRAPMDAVPSGYGEQINQTKQKMFALADQLSEGKLMGSTGKPINTVVNIGVGGSDLGPNMAVDALSHFHTTDTQFLFVSNIDPVQISRVLKQCDRESTLFIICSKTFTTLETLANANAARAWFLEQGGEESEIKQHFLAVSTNLEAAAAFGIPEENLFPMWDWVGGRYSLWSAIGLSICLAVGRKGFQEFLDGGRDMDIHFQSTPYEKNLPVILGLLGLWYSDYFQSQTQVLICYDQNLAQFADYLQQLDMESNGKTVTKNGNDTTYATGAILWGGVGTNTQHSFHQLIHQGSHFIPVDFLVAAQSNSPIANQQRDLFSNCLAQSQAMMNGRSEAELINEMRAQGKSESEAQFLAKHRKIAGNKPSNTIVYKQLTPFVLGQLIALYEHKIYTQSVLWDINAFDQWGVELGKQLSKTISSVMESPEKASKQDASTQGLINYYLNNQPL